jgi:hypothetical protein
MQWIRSAVSCSSAISHGTIGACPTILLIDMARPLLQVRGEYCMIRPRPVLDVIAFMLGFSLDSRGRLHCSFPMSPCFSICGTNYEPLTYLSARYAIQRVRFQDFPSDSCLHEKVHALSFQMFRFGFAKTMFYLLNCFWYQCSNANNCFLPWRIPVCSSFLHFADFAARLVFALDGDPPVLRIPRMQSLSGELSASPTLFD